VSAAFNRTSKPYARDALRATEAGLDDYARKWSRMHQDACLATKVRGEQSEELLDLRMACLGQRREELRALVDTLASADEGVVEHAVQAAQSLSDLHACEDVTTLRAPDAPPRDEAIRARIESVRTQLARAHALDAAGRYSDLLKVTEATSAHAAAIGFRPLVAAAQLELGRARHAVGDVPSARDALFSAAVAAEAGRDDVVAARAWIELARARGGLSMFAQAHEADRLAAAAIDRLRGDDLLTAHRELTLGMVVHKEGRYEEALALCRDSLEKRSKILGEGNLENADVLEAMAKSLRQLDRTDEAIATYQRALDIVQRALGPDHPRVARTLASTSLAFGDKGDSAAALDYAQRALAISERVLDADSPELAARLVDVANGLDANGRSEEAIAAYQRALAVRERAYGPDAAAVSDIDFDLAIVFQEQGRAAEALPFARLALAIREKAYGPTHPDVGAALSVLATALCGQKEYAQAAALQERALAIAEQAFGLDHAQTAAALEGLGQARIGLHDAKGAVAVLERAYALLEKLHENPTERGECAFELARALWDSGGDRARALRLAEEARSLCAENGQAAATLKEVERWQAAHGAPVPP
jgi:tetratricopeptide (TPR) repeat protein